MSGVSALKPGLEQSINFSFLLVISSSNWLLNLFPRLYMKISISKVNVKEINYNAHFTVETSKKSLQNPLYHLFFSHSSFLSFPPLVSTSYSRCPTAFHLSLASPTIPDALTHSAPPESDRPFEGLFFCLAFHGSSLVISNGTVSPNFGLVLKCRQGPLSKCMSLMMATIMISETSEIQLWQTKWNRLRTKPSSIRYDCNAYFYSY